MHESSFSNTKDASRIDKPETQIYSGENQAYQHSLSQEWENSPAKLAGLENTSTLQLPLSPAHILLS